MAETKRRMAQKDETMMMKDMLVYISGPITPTATHTLQQNIDEAVKVYFDLISAGIPAFCPHLGAHWDRAFDIDYEAWMAYDFAVIDRCTHVLMLPRWEQSAGAKRERDYAIEKGITVVHDVELLLLLPSLECIIRPGGKRR